MMTKRGLSHILPKQAKLPSERSEGKKKENCLLSRPTSMIDVCILAQVVPKVTITIGLHFSVAFQNRVVEKSLECL